MCFYYRYKQWINVISVRNLDCRASDLPQNTKLYSILSFHAMVTEWSKCVINYKIM